MIRIWFTRDASLAEGRGEARARRDEWVKSTLARHLGCAREELQILRQENEKPRIVRNDAPAGEASVSHSSDLLVLAWSPSVLVGIDVERIREMPSAAKIVDRYFSTEEKEEFNERPEGERGLAALQGWTRHEAVFKALGLGVRGMGERLDLKRVRDECGSWEADVSSRHFRVEPWLDCPDGFVASIAYESARSVQVITP